MANQDSPFGFRALAHKSGAPYSASGNVYHTASTDSQEIAPGDPVKLTGESDSLGIPTVTRAAAGDTVVGVMAGRTPGEGELTFDSPLNREASKEQYINVLDDPDIVFEVQADEAINAADIGLNANFVMAAPSQGKSGAQLDASTKAATQSLPLKIMRGRRIADNEIGSAFVVVEVMWNQHRYAGNKAGV